METVLSGAIRKVRRGGADERLRTDGKFAGTVFISIEYFMASEKQINLFLLCESAPN